MNSASILPPNWSDPEIGDICEITAGLGFPNELQGQAQGEIPFFKVGDISEAWQRREPTLTQAKHYLTHAEARSIRAKPLPAGAVVFAKIGAAIALNRRAILSVPSLIDNNCMGIVSDTNLVNNKYIFHFTCTLRLGDSARASIVPSLRKSDVSTIRLPLPPPNEQRRIVAKIEELFSDLDAGVAALERVRANLERYRAAVLKAAVEGKLTEAWRAQHPDTEPASVLLDRILTERRRLWEKDQLVKFAQAGKQPPKGWLARYPEPEGLKVEPQGSVPSGWTWATWEQLSGRVTVGHVGPMKHEYVESGIPFLRSQNIRENKFDRQGLLYISPRFHLELSKSVVRPGDLAVVRSGSVGVTCVIPDWLGEANCSDLVLIQKPLGILPEYGSYYMNSEARRLVKAGTVGIALTHFNTRSVAALPVPLPPLEEQDQIVSEVDSRLTVVDEIEAQVAANLKRATRLRQGILKRAFEGRLVPQDPTDEPAEKLLERIRDQRPATFNAPNGTPRTHRRGRRPKGGSTPSMFA